MSRGSALLQAERRRVRSLYDHLRNDRLGDRVRLDVKHYPAVLENARLWLCSCGSPMDARIDAEGEKSARFLGIRRGQRVRS